MPPFSRYNPLTHPNVKGAFKIPKGSVLKFVPGQGYTTAAAPPVRPPGAPAGATPSYESMLQNEGIYRAQTEGLKADSISDAARRDAAVKAAQYQYNDPSNDYSTMSEMERARQGQVGDMLASRAARGVMSSGGTNVAARNIGHEFGRQGYEALNQLTGQIGTLDQQFADAERARFGQRQEFLGDAQKRLTDAGIAPMGGVGADAPGAAGAATTLPGASAGAGAPPTPGGVGGNPQVPAGTPGGTGTFSDQPWVEGKDWDWAPNLGGRGRYQKAKGLRVDARGNYTPPTDQEMMLAAVKAGRAKALPGFDGAGRALPGEAARQARLKYGVVVQGDERKNTPPMPGWGR